MEAYTSRVPVARDQTLDPVAQTWVNGLPGLFTPWDRVRPTRGRSATANRPGARRRGQLSRRSTEARRLDGADQSGYAPGHGFEHGWRSERDRSGFALPAAPSACTWSLPLLDSRERVAGLILAIGGSRAAVLRYRAHAEGPRWTTVSDRLERPTDSVASAGRIVEGRLGRCHIALAWHSSAGVSWPADLAPDLDRVAVVTNDTTSTPYHGPGSGLGPSVQRPAPAPTTSGEFRARVLELYDAMQASLKRGDLTGFATQFNELGRILGRAPRD